MSVGLRGGRGVLCDLGGEPGGLSDTLIGVEDVLCGVRDLTVRVVRTDGPGVALFRAVDGFRPMSVADFSAAVLRVVVFMTGALDCLVTELVVFSLFCLTGSV